MFRNLMVRCSLFLKPTQGQLRSVPFPLQVFERAALQEGEAGLAA